MFQAHRTPLGNPLPANALGYCLQGLLEARRRQNNVLAAPCLQGLLETRRRQNNVLATPCLQGLAQQRKDHLGSGGQGHCKATRPIWLVMSEKGAKRHNPSKDMWCHSWTKHMSLVGLCVSPSSKHMFRGLGTPCLGVMFRGAASTQNICFGCS